MKQAWPHQAEMIRWILNSFESGTRRICAQLPTGAGKTFVLREIIDRIKASGRIVYCVTHRLSLVKQLGAELQEGGINFSYVLPGFPMLRCKVLVCSLMTVVRRFERMEEPGLIVIDECHRVRSSSYHKIFDTWPNAWILGTTATPSRTDGKPLRSVFDKLICGSSVRELIDLKRLSDFDYYAPMTIDMSDVHKVAGDYARNESVNKVDRASIIGNVIEHYRRYADHQPAIVSCVSIQHCEHVAAQFREAGYKAQAIHSKLSDERIESLLNGLKTGSLELLVQCELLGEGVDIKGASVLIQLRPTMSLVVFLQHIGRVLRYVEEKKAIILDHVGNYERHGLPDDPRKWNLDGIDKLDKGVLLYKRCDSCMRPVRKSMSICPYCGAAFDMREGMGRKLPNEREGELVNVRESEGFELVSESFEKHKRSTIAAIAAQAHTMAEAITIAREHGYENHRFAWYVWNKILKRRSA